MHLILSAGSGVQIVLSENLCGEELIMTVIEDDCQ